MNQITLPLNAANSNVFFRLVLSVASTETVAAEKIESGSRFPCSEGVAGFGTHPEHDSIPFTRSNSRRHFFDVNPGRQVLAFRKGLPFDITVCRANE